MWDRALGLPSVNKELKDLANNVIGVDKELDYHTFFCAMSNVARPVQGLVWSQKNEVHQSEVRRYLIMPRVTKRFLNTPCNVGDLLNGTRLLMFKLVCNSKVYLTTAITFMIKCYCQQSNCYHRPLIFYFCCQGFLAWGCSLCYLTESILWYMILVPLALWPRHQEETLGFLRG